MTLATADGFLRAIVETPEDTDLRLVYADWLEDNGDQERAEFIRLQIALANWPCDCDTSEERVYHDECRCKEKGELQRRERELLWNASALIQRPVSPEGKPHGMQWLSDWPLNIIQHEWEFSRGFVSHVTLTEADWLGTTCPHCYGNWCWYSLSGRRRQCPTCEGSGRVGDHGAVIVRAAPIERVTLTGKEPMDYHNSGEPLLFRRHGWRNNAMRSEESHALGNAPCDIDDELWQEAAKHGGEVHGNWLDFDTSEEAQAALSTAALAIARSRAGLPSLTLKGT